LAPLTTLLTGLIPTLEDLTSAFVFTITLDILILLVLYLLEALVGPRPTSRYRA